MANIIILYPSPGRGHLVSMVEFGKLILTRHPCFSVAIMIPHAPFETTCTGEYVASVSASTPSISFHHLPAVTLPDAFRPSDDIPTLLFEMGELNNPNLRKKLMTISESSKIKAFVIDFFCNASFKVSSSLNIPTYYYFTSAANGLAVLLYFPTLFKNTTKCLRELGSELLDFPGILPMPAKDLPVYLLYPECKAFPCFVDTGIQMTKSPGLIVNTFELLEERACKAILEGKCAPSQLMPPVYCIGPVLGRHKGGGEDQHECLSWLDSQPSRSVVFLCFGSMGVFCAKQLKEIAIGLERSGVNFLWVLRIPPPDDETRRSLVEVDVSIDLFLPEGFMDRTKDKGLVVKSWAPQIEILNHDSVGGFVTHCGWNSVLEAVCAGVPMLGWPLYAEQKINKAFIVDEIKVALPVAQSEDGLVSAAELEERVTELMDPEKGRAVRDRVIAMKEAAGAATNDGGSSRIALNKLIESIEQG